MADLNSLKRSVSKRNFKDNKLQSQTVISNINRPSTSAEETQVSHNDSPASKSYQIEKFVIGDIVWAKIGKFPLWPSIVCEDPVTKTHIKGSLSKKQKFSLHVRFCNDNGRRSWARTLESYEGKANLLSKYPNYLDLMKNNKKQMEMWNVAIKEADDWLKFDKEKRWIKFSRKNKLMSPCKSPNQSLSTSISNDFLSGTTTVKKNTDGSTHNVSNHLTNTSVGPPKGGFKKKLAVKRNYRREIKNKIGDDVVLRIPVSEDNHHTDGIEKIPSTIGKNVCERMKRDIEKLEAEGIRRMREWKALKTARTARIASTFGKIVSERMKRDVEKLEAEGIRKMREWKALKTAKTARIASRTVNGKKKI